MFLFSVSVILEYSCLLILYALKTEIFHFPGVEKIVVLKLVFAANQIINHLNVWLPGARILVLSYVSLNVHRRNCQKILRVILRNIINSFMELWVNELSFWMKNGLL